MDSDRKHGSETCKKCIKKKERDKEERAHHSLSLLVSACRAQETQCLVPANNGVVEGRVLDRPLVGPPTSSLPTSRFLIHPETRPLLFRKKNLVAGR